MMVRLLHTADLQLGMPFHKIPGDPGARLRELRLEAIDRVAEAARCHAVDLVLIAGDLFDGNTVDDRTVAQACTRLSRLDVPVLVIPGNHDHGGGPESVYRRASFTKGRPQNLAVLDSRDPHPVLGGKVVVLPAPLLRRHEIGDTTAHITAGFGREGAETDTIRIGLAHGGVISFDGTREAGGEATNFVDPDRAVRADLDFLALGDWHGLKQVNERTWYSGTPEPTSFKENAPGHLLIVEIPAHGALPVVSPVRVARTQWIRQGFRFSEPGDVDMFSAWFDSLEAPLDTLVRLELEGTLPLADLERLEDLLARAAGRLLHLRLRGRGVVPCATEGDIDTIAGDGYVRVAVEHLRRTGATADQDPVAARALQLLYRLQARAGTPC